MATSRGKAEVNAFIARTPLELKKLLRGAGRAGATVVADEAKARTQSHEVREAIKVRVQSDEGRVVAKVQVIGAGAYLAPWEEYGTSPHFISVDESQRGGRSVRRINDTAQEQDGDHSLVIGGEYVGDTVFHPGARPHPFLRPALDTKEAEAIKAAQAYIDRRVGRAGIAGDGEGNADGGS